MTAHLRPGGVLESWVAAPTAQRRRTRLPEPILQTCNGDFFQTCPRQSRQHHPLVAILPVVVAIHCPVCRNIDLERRDVHQTNFHSWRSFGDLRRWPQLASQTATPGNECYNGRFQEVRWPVFCWVGNDTMQDALALDQMGHAHRFED
eukprot:SAG31_NODE_4264_length_3397_cov_2.164948_3_plen_148_part_00